MRLKLLLLQQIIKINTQQKSINFKELVQRSDNFLLKITILTYLK